MELPWQLQWPRCHGDDVEERAIGLMRMGGTRLHAAQSCVMSRTLLPSVSCAVGRHGGVRLLAEVTACWRLGSFLEEVEFGLNAATELTLPS